MSESFGERVRALRVALGDKGEKTSLRTFGKAVGFNYQTWRGWETREDPPRAGRGDLARGLAQLEVVHARGMNPVHLAEWAWTGAGSPPRPAEKVAERPAPVNLDDRNDPRRDELVHRTPNFGTPLSTVTAHPNDTTVIQGPPSQIQIVDPEAAIERALQDLDAGRDARPTLRAAIALIRALKAVKAAGLGIVVVAVTGTSIDVQNNAKINRENFARFAEAKRRRKKAS